MGGPGQLQAAAGLMGFVSLLVIGGAAFALLWRIGLARPVWWLAGAALMLGATGYALQGSPFLQGKRAVRVASSAELDPAMLDLRDRLFGRFTSDAAYVAAADAMTASGNPDAAVRVILGGLRGLPRSVRLWTELGTVLAAHDGGAVSPASLLAFQQAARLAPANPAPRFYLGLAYARAGEFDRARALWRRAIALSPEGASYRRDFVVLLGILEQSAGVPSR